MRIQATVERKIGNDAVTVTHSTNEKDDCSIETTRVLLNDIDTVLDERTDDAETVPYKPSDNGGSTVMLRDALSRLAQVAKVINTVDTAINSGDYVTRHGGLVLSQWQAMISKLHTILIEPDNSGFIENPVDTNKQSNTEVIHDGEIGVMFKRWMAKFGSEPEPTKGADEQSDTDNNNAMAKLAIIAKDIKASKAQYTAFFASENDVCVSSTQEWMNLLKKVTTALGSNINDIISDESKLEQIMSKLAVSQTSLDQSIYPSSHIGICMKNGWQEVINNIKATIGIDFHVLAPCTDEASLKTELYDIKVKLKTIMTNVKDSRILREKYLDSKSDSIDTINTIYEWGEILGKIESVLSSNINDTNSISITIDTDKLLAQLEQIAVNTNESAVKHARYDHEALTDVAEVYSDWADLINSIKIVLSPEFRNAAISNSRNVHDAVAKLNKLASLEMHARKQRNKMNKEASAYDHNTLEALSQWRDMLNEMKDILNDNEDIEDRDSSCGE